MVYSKREVDYKDALTRDLQFLPVKRGRGVLPDGDYREGRQCWY